ncbi:hypothetical protein IWZ00DRAFT_571934 [Phyllosticta capitalensis]|uniref:uncharacterized protein n=1 Tax=Phyllosticta capitalensis TaxID=121624 RepID=UPI00312EBABA
MKNKSDPGGEVEVWIQSMLTGKRYQEFRFLGDEPQSRRVMKCYIEADEMEVDVFEVCIRTPASFDFGTWESLRHNVCMPVFGRQATYISAEEFKEAGTDIVRVLNYSFQRPNFYPNGGEEPPYQRLTFGSFLRVDQSLRDLQPPPSMDGEFERMCSDPDEPLQLADVVYEFEFHYRPKGKVPGFLAKAKVPAPKQGLPFSEGWFSIPNYLGQSNEFLGQVLARVYPDGHPELERIFRDDRESLTDDEEHGTGQELKPSRPLDVDGGGDPVSDRKSSTMREEAPHAQLGLDYRIEALDGEGVRIRLRKIEREKFELEMHLKKLQEDKKWERAC